jgi:ribosome-associated protein
MIKIPTSELQFSFIRASGPGGQNVNKVATAVELRWDAQHSSALTEAVRARFLPLAGKKITSQGEIIIKASRFRTQERNKQDALDRLYELIKRASIVPKKRKKTKPTFGSTQRRLESKKIHGKLKSLRRSKPNND